MQRGFAFLALILLVGCNGQTSASSPTAASSQTPPTAADVEAGLKHLIEMSPAPGSDGGVTLVVKSVQIGNPRPWVRSDGGNGNLDESVWPAKVSMSKHTHYNTRTHVEDDEYIYSVFKDSFNQWVVSQSSETGQTSNAHDEPAGTD